MLDRLARYIRNMDRVIVSCRPQDRVAWAEILKCSGIHGEVISDYAREIGALGVVHHPEAGVTGLLVSTGQLGMRSRAIKRVFDLATSITALIVLSPVMLLCALAIKLEDGGPVFFRQRRMGRGNTFFDIYKFRSMREAKADVAGRRSASKEDDRVTRVGRFLRRTSLDELPQLINVLRGEMSVVGPRPHALGSQAGEKMFWQVDRKYWQRHCLRPGIAFAGDIGTEGLLPSDAFDSIVFTQTLQYALRPDVALAQLYRALKPDGVLLLTVPAISPLEPEDTGWLWNFTPKVTRRLFDQTFGPAHCSIAVHGNVFAATCALQGIVQEDVEPARLDPVDPCYPVVISVRAVKPGAAGCAIPAGAERP